MTDFAQEPAEGAEDLSRRDMLRRVAVVGAATVWAVPAVQRLGMVAAAAVSPVPPPPPPPPPPPTTLLSGVGPSNFQMIVTWTAASGWFGLKFEPGNQTCVDGQVVTGTWDGLSSGTNNCFEGWDYTTNTDLVAYMAANAVVIGEVIAVTVDGQEATQAGFTLRLPSGVAFVVGEPEDEDGADVFDGQSKCQDDVTVNADGSYTFWKQPETV